MVESIGHTEKVITRLSTAYRDSTNLINYIKALLSEANTLEEVFQSLLSDRWIDTAIGVQLDIIGAIVGQNRILVDSTVLSYFGFATGIGSNSFGTLSDPAVGGRFRGIGESTTGDRVLTDDEYRIYIRARVIKNSITPTLPQMISFLKFLFNVDQIVIIDSHMSYTVQIGRPLSSNEKAFLTTTDLVPKVAAVNVNYQEYNSECAFGFGGIPTSKGFGSVSDSSIGGKFSSIIS